MRGCIETATSQRKKKGDVCLQDLRKFDQNSSNHHMWRGHLVAQWGRVADHFLQPPRDILATYDRDDDEGQPRTPVVNVQ